MTQEKLSHALTGERDMEKRAHALTGERDMEKQTYDLSGAQKNAMRRLLEKYEASRTYEGNAKVRQSFSLRPAEVFAGYTDDFTDPGQVRDFERDMEELEERGWIRVRWKKNRREIDRIILLPEAVPEIREAVSWKEKRERISDEIRFYRGWIGKSELTDRMAEYEIARLEAGKKPAYVREEADRILRLCLYLIQNKEDILERELSIEVLHDSKEFGKKYRHKVCRLLRKYAEPEENAESEKDAESKGDVLSEENAEPKKDAGSVENAGSEEGAGLEEDASGTDQELLEKYNVYQNSTYIYLKGDAFVRMSDGRSYELTNGQEIAFGSAFVSGIAEILLPEEVRTVVTVENLTSFGRMRGSDCFYIYLGGYHNRIRTQFLKLLWENNPGRAWSHFGDLDPDGFYIYENLREKTGIPFETADMDLATLAEYAEYGKPLERNDRAKADSLIRAGEYADLMRWMLDHNLKLEQEIVSWKKKGRL